MGSPEFSEKKPNTVLGILAHVDAGKTTLSEGLLYTAGALRKQGRVDNGDTLLDSHALEKARGITIFSSQAHFTVEDRPFTLLDTPGHVDFSAEMERTLSVLDAAILVISGTEGVQAHTKTLWRLLSMYAVPTVIFVTKMDYGRFSEAELLSGIIEEFGETCISFSSPEKNRDESIATADEEALRMFLETGEIPAEKIRSLFSARLITPVFFGSGLKNQGLNEFLKGLYDIIPLPSYGDTFRARVFKITHDASGNKLSHMKLLGGTLSVRDTVKEGERAEKISRISIMSGDRMTQTESARAGDIIIVSGLSDVKSGDDVGEGGYFPAPVLKPVMRYRIEFPEGTDIRAVLPELLKLQEEEPELELLWNPGIRELQAGLMGEVQAEILKAVISERLGISAEIKKGHVLYKETVAGITEGVGHYEPLRHYAEVHVLLEPLPPGSGLKFRTILSEDVLAGSWQRLILTHLMEKEHLGVLTGSPLTDTLITLAAGRAHLKHTEGGDFRQATYRAVRQGLMQADSRLLEPWYRFRLTLPDSLFPRAADDIRRMGGSFLTPYYNGGEVILSGRAPVSEMCDYAGAVAAYSGGLGTLLLDFDGYDKCHNPEEVLKEINYDPEKDTENSPDSVFCAHGAGFLVKWNRVPEYMHLESALSKKETPQTGGGRIREKASDSELEEIMMREFGPIRRRQYGERRAPNRGREQENKAAEKKKDILLVDGYNVIFAWQELRELSLSDIQAARDKLLQILVNFSAFYEMETVLVFDGYRVPGNRGEKFTQERVNVVFTPERESGDLFIERMIGDLSGKHNVKVVTSDAMIQLSALRKGVTRISSREFEEMIKRADEEISELLTARGKQGRFTMGDAKLLEVFNESVSSENKEDASKT